MIAHEIFAIISEGIVKNISVSYSYDDADRVAKCVYGDDAYAIDCTYCDCQEGDTYADGTFYGPDGTARTWLPNTEQRLEMLQAENQELKEVNDELTIAVADLIGGAE
jgi:hypothetical protein